MSEQEKDAVVGRVMREYKANEEHIGKLLAEASRIGSKLSDLGLSLTQRPETVYLEGSAFDPRYTHQRITFSAGDLDTSKLTALTNDYRAALLTRERLGGELRQLGYPVPGDSEARRGYGR